MEITLYTFRWISWSNLEKIGSYFEKLPIELDFAKITFYSKWVLEHFKLSQIHLIFLMVTVMCRIPLILPSTAYFYMFLLSLILLFRSDFRWLWFFPKYLATLHLEIEKLVYFYSAFKVIAEFLAYDHQGESIGYRKGVISCLGISFIRNSTKASLENIWF